MQIHGLGLIVAAAFGLTGVLKMFSITIAQTGYKYYP
jgi:hypothetical protein